MSNGLSSRRSTLKRPVVCRSKKEGNCGTCTFDVTWSQTSGPQGGTLQLTLLLNCDPKPFDETFTVYLQGPVLLVPLNPQITVGNGDTFDVILPAMVGTFSVTVFAINSQGCLYQSEVQIDVF